MSYLYQNTPTPNLSLTMNQTALDMPITIHRNSHVRRRLGSRFLFILKTLDILIENASSSRVFLVEGFQTGRWLTRRAAKINKEKDANFREIVKMVYYSHQSSFYLFVHRFKLKKRRGFN